MISVIIVNYNREDLLRKCLDSVQGQSYKDIETIVVDNGSSDGTRQMLGTYYPEVKLLCNTRNLLLCKAYNQGIDASKRTFVLCMNNDVILDKDYLKEAISSIGLDTRIGMVSGKILRQAKLSTISAQRSLIDSTGLFLGRNRKPVERGYRKIDKGQYEKAGYVFGVCGACAFLRRSMLMALKDENGYFDERFGMYYEDLDLCWRAQKKALDSCFRRNDRGGWKAYYNPKAVAYHMRGGTALNQLLRTTHYARRTTNFICLPLELKKRYIKNRYKCMRKNDSLKGVLLNLPFILCYEIKIWPYFVLFFLTRFVKHCILSPWRNKNNGNGKGEEARACKEFCRA